MKRLSKGKLSRIKNECLKGARTKEIIKRFGISKTTASKLMLLFTGRKLSYLDKFIEANKKKYIIKNKCCSCEKRFKNNWKHYKWSGNFCNNCIVRISNLSGTKKEETKGFYKLLLKKLNDKLGRFDIRIKKI